MLAMMSHSWTVETSSVASWVHVLPHPEVEFPCWKGWLFLLQCVSSVGCCWCTRKASWHVPSCCSQCGPRWHGSTCCTTLMPVLVIESACPIEGKTFCPSKSLAVLLLVRPPCRALLEEPTTKSQCFHQRSCCGSRPHPMMLDSQSMTCWRPWTTIQVDPMLNLGIVGMMGSRRSKMFIKCCHPESWGRKGCWPLMLRHIKVCVENINSVVNKMLTLSKTAQVRVLTKKVEFQPPYKINMLCITDMLCGTWKFTWRCRAPNVDIVHVENLCWNT